MNVSITWFLRTKIEKNYRINEKTEYITATIGADGALQLF